MKALAENCTSMPRSGIREIMELAADYPDVIHLEVGEPNFDTPAHIVEAGAKAAKDGFTKYTPNAGITSLREAIALKLQTDNAINASIENVVVTTGGVGGLTSAIIACAQSGDEVLLPDPGWPNYVSAARFMGVEVIQYPLLPEEGFLPDFDALEDLVTARCKLILINSPSNPTGAVFPRSTIEKLVEFAQRHDLYMLSDEVYEHIVFEGEHVSPATLDPNGRVLGSYSFSKSYAMTGWRVGYVATSAEVALVIAKLQEPLTSCVSGISQKAAEAALNGSQACVTEMRESYKRRRDIAVDILRTNNLLTYVPQGAFYILVDISPAGMESYEFAKKLIKTKQVAVAPGGTFGQIGQRFVRVSMATAEDQLREGLERTCNFIASPMT